jgi:D-glycero-D-manno-heptose 1,7-bisphosphate phosphatase
MALTKAVFLDKDGTLVEDRPYDVDAGRMVLVPGALAALRQLQDRGYKLIVISNQAGVAHGHFPEQALVPLGLRLAGLLAAGQVRLAGFYYCPHHPGGRIERYAVRCDCRKPAAGLILRAAREHEVDLDNSWFIGDILDDVEAGRRAGCRAVLIDNGNETEWTRSPLRDPHFIAGDLCEAARRILDAEPTSGAPRQKALAG